jgi:glycerol-3-phosphate dehydrogenase
MHFGNQTRSLPHVFDQVHPAKLTHALMTAAEQAAGAQLLLGTVTGINTADGAVTGVRVRHKQGHAAVNDKASSSSSSSGGGGGDGSGEVDVPADAVVLAMGPWTDAARAWLPTAPEMSGRWMLCHSGWQVPHNSLRPSAATGSQTWQGMFSRCSEMCKSTSVHKKPA